MRHADILRTVISITLFIAVTFSAGGNAWSATPRQKKFIGKIETLYAARGPFSIAAGNAAGYQFYYPQKLKGKYPIIAWGNGSRSCRRSYQELLHHLASWGFVVLVPHSTLSGSGKEILSSIDDLIKRNSTPGTFLFGRLIPEKIGIAGHALGGGAAVNAASDPRITCIAPLTPAPANAADLKAPMFLITTAKNNDFSPEMVRLTTYSRTKTTAIFGTIDTQFTPDGGLARGYLTAWFRYLLQGDRKAGKAFAEKCEICNHPNWKIERKQAAQ